MKAVREQNDKLSDRAARSVVRADFGMIDARISSHDDQGHSKRWNIDAPVNFHAQVTRFIEQGQYEFDNVSEFIRWCVLFSMDYLERLDPPRYRSNVQVLKAIAADNGQSETRRAYLQSIEKTSMEVFELLGLGMHAEAERHVAKVLEHIRQLAPSDPWRVLYTTAIKTRFGHVLKRGKISDLTEVTFGQDEEQK